MKKLVSRLVAVLAVATSGVALAADVVFPNADGTGDLMSETAWNGPVPTVDRPKLTTAGTYTASTNGTLNGLLFSQTVGELLTIDLAKNVDPTKLKLTQPLDFDRGTSVEGMRKTVFKGGVYDFNGGSALTYASSGPRNFNEIVLDGCVWTNIGDRTVLNFGGSAGSAKLSLRNGSVFDASGAKAMVRLDEYGKSTSNVLEIASGSRFRIVKTGSDYSDVFRMSRRENTDNYVSDSRVIVTGEGSELYVQGYTGCTPTVGGTGCGDWTIVKDGGKATFLGGSGTFFCGNGNCSANNGVYVAGEGSTLTSGASYIAYAGLPATCTNNYIFAVNEGLFASDGLNIWGGARNGFVVSNGTVRLGFLRYAQTGVDYGTNFILL